MILEHKKKNKAGLGPVWAAWLNSRWLPGAVKKNIPDSLGKSIWLSAVASVLGISVFLYHMGEAKLLDLKLQFEGTEEHVLGADCVSATIVWDHREGRLLDVGRRR